MFRRNMIRLREYIFVIGFIGLYMVEKLIHNQSFSDDAWFSLRRQVNSQNNRYLSAENPRFIHEPPAVKEDAHEPCNVSSVGCYVGTC
jgi:hypothetical protein